MIVIHGIYASIVEKLEMSIRCHGGQRIKKSQRGSKLDEEVQHAIESFKILFWDSSGEISRFRANKSRNRYKSIQMETCFRNEKYSKCQGGRPIVRKDKKKFF